MIDNSVEKFQKGFTAVELLITLFVASIFLFSGYQLYNQVTDDGRDAEKMAKISNIVYEKAQKEGASRAASNPYGCRAASQSTATEQISNVGNVQFTTVVSCPQGIDASADLFLIKVTANYKNNNVVREVQHALYAN